MTKAMLITGALRGISAAIPRRAAADGYTISINYEAAAARAEALVTEIQTASAKAHALKANIADQSEVRGFSAKPMT